jgi:hypothetical protein
MLAVAQVPLPKNPVLKELINTSYCNSILSATEILFILSISIVEKFIKT